MSALPAKLDQGWIAAGSEVEWFAGGRKQLGTVETWKTVGERQVLTVRRADGTRVGLLAEKATEAGASRRTDVSRATQIVAGPVSREEATAVAQAIVAGRADSVRLPINKLILLLATALLQETDQPQEGS